MCGVFGVLCVRLYFVFGFYFLVSSGIIGFGCLVCRWSFVKWGRCVGSRGRVCFCVVGVLVS